MEQFCSLLLNIDRQCLTFQQLSGFFYWNRAILLHFKTSRAILYQKYFQGQIGPA